MILNTSIFIKRKPIFIGVVALLSLIVLIPVRAQTQSFPNTPLQVSESKPPANIMFILDDSGSMAFDYLPDTLASGDFNRKNYLINPLAYNPNITYEPWKDYNGNLMSGGQQYTNVYSNDALLSGNINLKNYTITFYGPVNNTIPSGDTAKEDYYEYTISSDRRGNITYERCEYKKPSGGGWGWPWGGWGGSDDGDWTKNCVTGNQALPNAQRNLNEELSNYATWYSYHRTRIKTAKASVTDAFSQLRGNVRVGFDTIWNRNEMDIPVNNNNGLFEGQNKKNWFNRVINANASGGTPLHGALQRAGNYFSRKDSSGPWGPESGSAQYSCRQNFTILTTDGYWNSNSGYYTSVGNADGTKGDKITSSSGKTYQYIPERPYKDNSSDTLADVAMYYWKNDLRTDLTNNVPSSDSNPAFWQHMDTFGISIGDYGTLDAKSDLSSIENGSKQWPDPWKTNSSRRDSWNNESPRRIDDLWHATIDGHGTFSVATSPKQFSQSIQSALGNIQKILASGSNVSTSSTTLQTNTRIFHASYYSGVWTGEVSAFDISQAGISQSASWLASKHIPAYQNRHLFTFDTKGELFPTSTQKTSMLTGASLPNITEDQVAKYISGDQSMELSEGGVFRNRESLIGDIIDSSPVYSFNNDTLFIGSNDGMLHAINASTGQEYFGYFPKGINYKDLGSLANPNYAHRYFVDGKIAVSNFNQTPGKNYFVAALGYGGKGVFGLDVTDSSTFNKNNVLWDETGSTNDKDMGYVLGDIIIAKANDGLPVAIVPNGIDSTSGHSVLYIFNLKTGAIIKKIDTGACCYNGLSSPRGWDKDGNGTVDYVYAGDLNGNLWRFDLSSSSPSNWKVSFNNRPLFSAKDSYGKSQPISGGLALGKEPFTGNIWVLFGTGKYISQSDLSDTSQQSIYGIMDLNKPVSKSSLEKRKIEILGNNGQGSVLRSFETYTPLPTGKEGWYLNLGSPYQGERMIERGILSGRVFTFPTIIPISGNPCESSGKGFINAIDAFTGTTVSSDGVNHSYLDVGNDGNKDNDYLKDGDGNKLPVGSIESNIGMVTKPILVGNQIIYGGSSGGKESNKVDIPKASSKQLSWREVY